MSFMQIQKDNTPAFMSFNWAMKSWSLVSFYSAENCLKNKDK